MCLLSHSAKARKLRPPLAVLAALAAALCGLVGAGSGSSAGNPWTLCVFVGWPRPALEPTAFAHRIGLDPSVRVYPLDSLTAVTILDASEIAKSCGDHVVVLQENQRVVNATATSAWIAHCLAVGAGVGDSFVGCSLTTQYFLHEDVALRRPGQAAMDAFQGFTSADLVVSTDVLANAAGVAADPQFNDDTPWHVILSHVCRKWGYTVLYPPLGSHESLLCASPASCALPPVPFDPAPPAHVRVRQWTPRRGVDAVALGDPLVPAETKLIASSLTIVIPTYQRLDTFLGTLRHYSTLPFVHEIVGVWNDGAPPPFTHATGATLARMLGLHLGEDAHLPPVRIIAQANNSLHNRFGPPAALGIRTLAVLSLDDDIRIARADVGTAWRVWSAHPDRLVGFDFAARGVRVRDAAVDAAVPNATHVYVHTQGRCEHLRTNGTVALTGAALFHVSWMDGYNHNDTVTGMARGRQIVSDAFNGEDLLFGYMVASVSGVGPVIVRDVGYDAGLMKGSGGLHKKAGHYGSRDVLVSQLAALFGDVLQRHATVFVDASVGVKVLRLTDPAPPIPSDALCVQDFSTRLRAGHASPWLLVIAALALCVCAGLACARRLARVQTVINRYSSIVTLNRGKEHVV